MPRNIIAGIMSFCVKSIFQVKAVDGKSKTFGKIVGIHEGPLLIPLISIRVMEEINKIARASGL